MVGSCVGFGNWSVKTWEDKNNNNMGNIWKVTSKQQISAKRGSSGFAVPPGVVFTVVTSGDGQPQAKDIEGPFLNAVGASSINGSCSTSWFKIEKA
jgi:hypothetical protein